VPLAACVQQRPHSELGRRARVRRPISAADAERGFLKHRFRQSVNVWAPDPGAGCRIRRWRCADARSFHTDGRFDRQRARSTPMCAARPHGSRTNPAQPLVLFSPGHCSPTRCCFIRVHDSGQ